MENLINVSHLFKSYGKNEVLKDITFKANSGQIIGLLGPNGSGKTTLIKILTGLIKDYKGLVRINNMEIGPETKSLVAFLPDKSYLPDWMTPIDAIKYMSDFYEDFDRKKAEDMIVKFDLNPKQRLKTMSKGQQEKVNLILVMSRRAALYILDEPLGGVDPAARDGILNLIRNNYAEGSTVLLSTHLIYDVESIFDRVLMISNGHLVVDAFVDDVKKDGKSVEAVFKEVFSNAW